MTQKYAILIALPGLHRYNRGAEIAFIALAMELTKSGDRVTLLGSGTEHVATPYKFLRASERSGDNDLNDFPLYQFLEMNIVMKN